MVETSCEPLGDEALEICEGIRGDGEVLGVDFEHVEAVVRDSSQHDDEDAYQRADSQSEWQGHANKSSDTHLADLCFNDCGVRKSECVNLVAGKTQVEGERTMMLVLVEGGEKAAGFSL